MNVRVKQLDGITLAAKSGTGHWTVMDTEDKFGGHEGAAKPLELVLMGLGGCSGMDIVSILKKMRVKMDDFEVNVEGDQSDEHPRVFQKIRVEYLLYGNDIDPAKVEQAIELSQTKYCSVWAMLEKSVVIKSSYRILPEKL
jgi:putative redox protein